VQMPAWQLVEQQSAPEVHAWPSTLHCVEEPGISAHTPLVHVFVQHCSAPEHAWPTSRHRLAAHLPFSQTLVQQSPPTWHASPVLRHRLLGTGQRPSSPHTPVQHRAPEVRLHAAPCCKHSEPGPASGRGSVPASFPVPASVVSSGGGVGGSPPQSHPTTLKASASALSISNRFACFTSIPFSGSGLPSEARPGPNWHARTPVRTGDLFKQGLATLETPKIPGARRGVATRPTAPRSSTRRPPTVGTAATRGR
jgi:hypothetical protein